MKQKVEVETTDQSKMKRQQLQNSNITDRGGTSLKPLKKNYSLVYITCNSPFYSCMLGCQAFEQK